MMKNRLFQLRRKRGIFWAKKPIYQKPQIFVEKTLNFVVKNDERVNEYLKRGTNNGP